ncbi:MAG: hypothetical protein JNM40_19010 [Myxococcales bacterium]|nr:hypothetical protein [Myxococcales bacterium]
MSSSAKEKILSLLKFLSDNIPSGCQVEIGTLQCIAGHICYGDGPMSTEHTQLLQELEREGVLTTEADSYTVNGDKIPPATEAMQDDKVFELLLKSMGISGLTNPDASTGPNKDIRPIMWDLLLDFVERYRKEAGASS